MTARKRPFPVVPVISFVILFGIGIWLTVRKPAGNGDGLPFQYDISHYKAVPDGMLKWAEESPIELNAKRIPQALAISADDRLAVGFSDGIEIFRDGVPVAACEIHQSVYCLTFHRDGRLFAGVTNRVAVFNSKNYEMTASIDLGETARLTSMTFHGDSLFVGDFGQRCVWRLDKNGSPDLDYSGPGGFFVIPSPYFDVAADSDGLWIVNPGRHRIGRYSPSFKAVRSIGKTGMGPDGFSGCCNPTHIALQADGSVIALEKGLPRIRIFEVDGTLREFVTDADDLSGTTPATDLAVMGDGRIALLDPTKKQVRLFKRVFMSQRSISNRSIKK